MANMGHGDMVNMTNGTTTMTMGGGGGGHMSMGGWTHMTFYQGKNSEILFKNWPGRNDGGMYALALVVVFVMGVLVELVASLRLTRSGLSRPVNGLVQTAFYSLRVGLAYMLMLAVMSFNVGVLLVAIGGHALGFFLFNSALRTKNATAVNNVEANAGCKC